MLRYHLGQAFRGMVRRPGLQLACVGALAMALLIVGLAALGAHNIARLTADWGRGRQMTVYMHVGAERQQVRGVHRLLASRPEIKQVTRVSPKEAFGRLSRALDNDAALLSGLGTHALPVSFEVQLRAETKERDIRPLLGVLSASPAVAEADYQGSWAEKLGALLAVVRGGTAFIALIVGIACLYIVASTIRLGVLARRREIEIQKLVGATSRFVRAPFLLEGALQGLLGAILGLLTLFLLFNWASPALSTVLNSAFAHTPLTFFAPLELALGLGGGALLGLLGSGLAVGRHLA